MHRKKYMAVYIEVDANGAVEVYPANSLPKDKPAETIENGDLSSELAGKILTAITEQAYVSIYASSSPG